MSPGQGVVFGIPFLGGDIAIAEPRRQYLGRHLIKVKRQDCRHEKADFGGCLRPLRVCNLDTENPFTRFFTETGRLHSSLRLP
jgi:hypothetical protein